MVRTRLLPAIERFDRVGQERRGWRGRWLRCHTGVGRRLRITLGRNAAGRGRVRRDVHPAALAQSRCQLLEPEFEGLAPVGPSQTVDLPPPAWTVGAPAWRLATRGGGTGRSGSETKHSRKEAQVHRGQHDSIRQLQQQGQAIGQGADSEGRKRQETKRTRILSVADLPKRLRDQAPDA